MLRMLWLYEGRVKREAGEMAAAGATCRKARIKHMRCPYSGGVRRKGGRWQPPAPPAGKQEQVLRMLWPCKCRVRRGAGDGSHQRHL
jgi:hypothetical protein